jgi:hypothetical protein
MPKTETSTTRTRASVSISVCGDRDPRVISFLRGSYGIPRLPVKIMDAVNAFFLVFAVNSKKDRQDTEVIEAAQESISLRVAILGQIWCSQLLVRMICGHVKILYLLQNRCTYQIEQQNFHLLMKKRMKLLMMNLITDAVVGATMVSQ